jgi:peptide/nickel transport system substrate-binding protein
MSGHRRWWVLVCAPLAALAASRARDGGTLRIAVPPEVGADVGAETPEGASVRGLTAAPLCRLGPDGHPVPVLASVERRGEAVAIVPRPGVRFLTGAPLGASELARAWLRGPATGAVGRGLLAPLKGGLSTLEAARQSREPVLLLPLAFPWPDLEASLCHPALAPLREGGAAREGIGPYAPDGPERARAVPGFPEGRPHPDTLEVRVLSLRNARRALQRHEVQVVFGDGTDGAGPALFATYLLLRPAAAGVGQRVAARLDRRALVQSFVGGASVPLPGLLPPALGGPAEPAASTAPPGPAAPAVLLYASDRPTHRAVAERLQILLRDASAPLTLRGLPATEAAAAWERGEGDAMLRSVLLPPLPAPALAVVLALSGDAEAARRELPALGAISDATQRGAKTAERAVALAPALPLLPLYVESARARLEPRLVDVRRDAFGLWVLDDAWWP